MNWEQIREQIMASRSSGGQDDTVCVESVESVHGGRILPMQSAGL